MDNITHLQADQKPVDLTPAMVASWRTQPANRPTLIVNPEASLHQRAALAWLVASETHSVLESLALGYGASPNVEKGVIAAIVNRLHQLEAMLSDLGDRTATLPDDLPLRSAEKNGEPRKAVNLTPSMTSNWRSPPADKPTLIVNPEAGLHHRAALAWIINCDTLSTLEALSCAHGSCNVVEKAVIAAAISSLEQIEVLLCNLSDLTAELEGGAA